MIRNVNQSMIMSIIRLDLLLLVLTVFAVIALKPIMSLFISVLGIGILIGYKLQ